MRRIKAGWIFAVAFGLMASGLLMLLIADAPKTIAATFTAVVKGPGVAPTVNDPAVVVTIGPNTPIKRYLSSGGGQFGLAVISNTQLTVPAGATCAYITVEASSVRRTSDGSSATTSTGTLLSAGTQWADCGPLSAYKFTAVSGSPLLDVEYFK